MKLRSLFGAALPILAHCTWAQSTFNKAFEYESHTGGLEPVSGPKGFLICSTVRYNSGYTDGFQFTRFDSLGNVVHTKAFSTGPIDNVMQNGALCRVRSDGTFSFLFGNHPNGGYKNSLRVFNTDPTGVLNWNTKVDYADPDYSIGYLGATDQAFEETPDGGYLITAVRSFPTTSVTDTVAPMMVKLDAVGNVLWNKTYDLDERIGYDILSHVNGAGELLFGFHADTFYTAMSDNCILTKVSANGNTQWSKRLDGFQGRFSDAELVDGRYVLSAMDTSGLYLLEIDSAGTPLTGKYYAMSVPFSTWGTSLVATRDGGFVLTTLTLADSFNADVFFFKVDSSGTVLWERSYGNDNSERLINLVENEDSTFTMATSTQLVAPWYTVFNYLSGLDATGMNDCVVPVSGLVTETPFTFSMVDVVLDEFEAPMVSQAMYIGDSLAYDPLMMDTCLLDVGAEELRAADELRIYPNPTIGPAQVHIPAQLLGARFTMLDLMGKEVLSTTLTGITTTIELGALPAGVYPYRVSGHGGTMLFGRAVKE